MRIEIEDSNSSYYSTNYDGIIFMDGVNNQ